MNAVIKQRLLLLAVICAALYGVSYQQFRHFDPGDPRGANDALSYLKMSHGDFEVPATHRYRFVVPLLAGAVQPVTGRLTGDPVQGDLLSFYVVNFLIMAATAYLFFYLLMHYGFLWPLAMLGTLFFCCNRITALTVGTPLVDSLYYFAIAGTLYLVQRKRFQELCWATPFLALSKETLFPFLFLPLVRGRGYRVPQACALGIALFFCWIARRAIDLRVSPEAEGSFTEVVSGHFGNIVPSLLRLLGPAGWHDLQNGFSLLLVLAAIGEFIHHKRRHYRMPPELLAVLPLCLGYALLSNNLGRMFFAASFVIIPYALVAVEAVMGELKFEVAAEADEDGDEDETALPVPETKPEPQPNSVPEPEPESDPEPEPEPKATSTPKSSKSPPAAESPSKKRSRGRQRGKRKRKRTAQQRNGGKSG